MFETLDWKRFSHVTRDVKKIKGKTNLLKMLKFQTNMRTKGCNFNNFQIAYSKNGVQNTPEELTKSLNDAIRAMASMQTKYPEISVPLRKNLPVIGALTKDMVEFDSKQVVLIEELQ